MNLKKIAASSLMCFALSAISVAGPQMAKADEAEFLKAKQSVWSSVLAPAADMIFMRAPLRRRCPNKPELR